MWHSRDAAGGRASDVTVTLPERDPWILRPTSYKNKTEQV